MTNLPGRLSAVFIGACATLFCFETDAVAQTPELQTQEYSLWEGEWLEVGSDLEENIYTILRIREVDGEGYLFETEYRDIPYGPNAIWSGENQAVFQSPLSATHAATATRFTLSVNPDDLHDRQLEMTSLPSAHNDASSGTFIFRRTVFRAGFDCERAGTLVEHAICGNELLALGDFELGVLYRELQDSLTIGAEEELRLEQRSWLLRRNRDCGSEDAVDETCLAHLYADRLVALARRSEPHLGAAPRFNAAYGLARIVLGADLRRDTAFRLAMYPQQMDTAGSATWQADPDGLLFEQAYTSTRNVWSANVDFRFADMLYVDWYGTVWTVQLTETVEPLHPDSGIGLDQLWMVIHRDPLTIRTEAQPGAPRPEPVARWLAEHGVTEAPSGSFSVPAAEDLQ